MMVQNPLRCILLWLILVIAMILHFNYNIGGLFHGIEIKREGATGVIPIGTHVIRNIFYHLPIVWILVLLYSQHLVVRLGLFIISLVYAFSHGMHLVGEFKDPDASQIPLLSLTLVVSLILSYEHFRYWRAGRPS